MIDREGEFDVHGRYLIKNRILYKEGMMYRPIVNLYADILKYAMQAAGFHVNEKNIRHMHIYHMILICHIIEILLILERLPVNF